jgi:hypothetical protein
MSKIVILSQLLQELPLNKLKELTQKFETDKHCKGLDTRTHLVSMLFCHFAQADSLRDISIGLSKTNGHLNHLGMRNSISKSSMSYHNTHRSYEVFKEFFYAVCDHLKSKPRLVRRKLKKMSRDTYLLDATV